MHSFNPSKGRDGAGRDLSPMEIRNNGGGGGIERERNRDREVFSL